jgi:hypothetical protein
VEDSRLLESLGPMLQQIKAEYCHTLKYLILGCECLLQCVHLSIGFSENLKDFSGNYSIYPRSRSIFIWKALKFFFMSPKYFIGSPRVPN